jgi:hypothetical protein
MHAKTGTRPAAPHRLAAIQIQEYAMSLSDPLRAPGQTPRRAEPLQPDRPGRGGDRLDEAADPASARSGEPGSNDVADRLEQSRTAIDNVRHP